MFNRQPPPDTPWPPGDFSEEEKRRWEIYETYLKSRDLKRSEWRRVATWSTIVSMTTTLVTIALTVSVSSFQRTKSETDLSAKNLELQAKNLEYQRKVGELDQKDTLLTAKDKALTAREAAVKASEAQKASRDAAYQTLSDQYQALQTRLAQLAERAKAGDAVAQETASIASNMSQTVKDNQQVALAFASPTPALAQDKRSAIDSAAEGLFAGSYPAREKSFNLLVNNLLGNPQTIPAILRTAASHLTNGAGISNSLEVIRLSERRWLTANEDEIKALLNKIESSPAGKFPIVKRRITQIRDRFKRAESEK